MTNKTSNLDIAQRIVKAMKDSPEPTQPVYIEFNPENHTLIGEVPKHLRQLHNLVDELGDEVTSAALLLKSADERFETVRSVFFTTLQQHVPISEDDFDYVVICKDWKVAGQKRSDD